MSDTSSTSVVISLACLVFAVSLLVASRKLYCAVAPLWLIPQGEYARARGCYEVSRRGLAARLHEGTRLVCDYGIGLCAHLQGDQEEALRILRALPYERLSRPMQLCVDTTIGSSLLILDRDLHEARARFEAARLNIHAPDLVLAEAVTARKLGHHRDAARLFEEASTLLAEGVTQLSGQALVRRDAATVRLATALMRGWYLILVGSVELARPFLLEAAKAPRGPTRSKALELLEGAPAGGDDAPPSSLSPLIHPSIRGG